jgi:hypothetical protein
MTVTSGFGQYFENAVLNWYRGTTFPAVPAKLYLALFTTPPVNGVDSAAVEVTGGSYARKDITPNTTNFVAPSGAAPASSASGANFVFATPAAGWGNVTGWALYDAATAGNLLQYGTFTSVSVGTGDTVEFLSGNLTLSVS